MFHKSPGSAFSYPRTSRVVPIPGCLEFTRLCYKVVKTINSTLFQLMLTCTILNNSWDGAKGLWEPFPGWKECLTAWTPALYQLASVLVLTYIYLTIVDLEDTLTSSKQRSIVCLGSREEDGLAKVGLSGDSQHWAVQGQGCMLVWRRGLGRKGEARYASVLAEQTVFFNT